ncbi:gpW family protein [Azospirillum doebereinerae]|uniref:gpW family protein n=1 Tax=Azospirillum doebereinerae TaxID=92933 RepID=UPI001EE62F6F|nr:gpW family protein [Azospirillum doebereinerae]MCG5243962.1 gpW family protein [Azospirillum doebereinerae]
MALTPEDDARLRRYLQDAEEALHRVSIGKQRVQVRADTGETVQYAPADAAQLRAYIAGLKIKLGLGGSSGPITLAL